MDFLPAVEGGLAASCLLRRRGGTARVGRPLTLAEVHHLRSMVQRLAALLVLQPHLDRLYEASSAAPFTAEDLGLRA